MKKRVISLVLALALVIAAFPASAFALPKFEKPEISEPKKPAILTKIEEAVKEIAENLPELPELPELLQEPEETEEQQGAGEAGPAEEGIKQEANAVTKTPVITPSSDPAPNPSPQTYNITLTLLVYDEDLGEDVAKANQVESYEEGTVIRFCNEYGDWMDSETEYFAEYTLSQDETVADPQRDYFTFKGWIKADEDDLYWAEDPSATYYYASWEGEDVEVRFKPYDPDDEYDDEYVYVMQAGYSIDIDPNGGEYPDGDISIEYAFSMTIDAPTTIADPVRENHEFLGWELNDFWGELVAQWRITEISEDYKDCKKDNECILDTIEDVQTYKPYHDAIHFCIENEMLINDTTSGYFYPDKNCTPRDFIAALYTLQLCPGTSLDYSEVKQELYDEYQVWFSVEEEYRDAVLWAYENGLFTAEELENGDISMANYGELTKKQAALISYRYVKNVCGKLEDTKEFKSFNEAKIFAWAAETFGWDDETKTTVAMVFWMIKYYIQSSVFGKASYLTKAEAANVILKLYNYCK